MRLKYRIDKILFIWYNSYKELKGELNYDKKT